MRSAAGGEWRAAVRVHTGDPASAERLRRALLPESRREVPRARSRVRAVAGDLVEIRIVARETGALRAALNTYLGWTDLAAATEKAARVVGRAVSPPRR
jgi:tRNA threonylcarbamoyladenosine modification (KEOPS) complex  Pcc1 subunit